MFELRAFVYKTLFSDGRADYLDLVVAKNEAEALQKAAAIAQGVNEQGYLVDEFVRVEIVGPLASQPSTLAEDIALALED